MQSLLKYNTFNIDQACWQVYEPSTAHELKALLPQLRNQPLLVIGGGSNLLLTKDFEGNVLRVNIRGVEQTEQPDGHVLLRCGAGETWDDVVALSVARGLHGMENLSLIPGDVGASAVQNIGAYGAEAKDIIVAVDCIETATGQEYTFTNSECDYAYRHSKFKTEWKGRFVITHVTYRLATEAPLRLDYGNLRQTLSARGIDTLTLSDVRDAVIEIRQQKLPDHKILGNAGSFFMNPVVDAAKFAELQQAWPGMPYYEVESASGPVYKIPAGWMIEQCGWKGRRLGHVGVHDRQALVLVNHGGATGAEVLSLCNDIIRSVSATYGIELRPEVNII